MAGSTPEEWQKYDALWHAQEAADLLASSRADKETGKSVSQHETDVAKLRGLSHSHALTSIALSLAAGVKSDG